MESLSKLDPQAAVNARCVKIEGKRAGSPRRFNRSGCK